MFHHKLRKSLLLYIIIFSYFNSTISFFLCFNLTDNTQTNIIGNNLFSVKSSLSGPPHKLDFKYYKSITIDEGKVSGSGSYKNFPVLISILDPDLHIDVQSNGNDIAFANSTAWLDHEIEYFNQSFTETQAKLIAWVRIPNLSTSLNTTIYDDISRKSCKFMVKL